MVLWIRYTVFYNGFFALSTGQADLTSLYGLIANNFSWLERQFDIQFVMPPSGTENVPQFTLRSEVDHTKEFDACKEFEKIGTRKFDHVCLVLYILHEALSWKLKWVFLIAFCLLSVLLSVHPSVNFSHFHHLPRTTGPISTKLNRKHS